MGVLEEDDGTQMVTRVIGDDDEEDAEDDDVYYGRITTLMSLKFMFARAFIVFRVGQVHVLYDRQNKTLGG